MKSEEVVNRQMAAVCTALTNYEVDFMIVGGYAVFLYGYRRPSMITTYKPELKADFDFWYKPSLSNFQKLLKALYELGVDITELQQIVFDPKKTFLKIPHKEFHTDFLPVILGLESFSEAKKNASLAEIEGNKFPVIGYNDLILSKLAVNRTIDKEDIKALNKIRKQNDGSSSIVEESKTVYKKIKKRSEN
jgi:predicted nucleotidyltransferase